MKSIAAPFAMLVASLFIQSASAATPEQAARAATCRIAQSVIEQSIRLEPVLQRFDEDAVHASRGAGGIQIILFTDYSCAACKGLNPQFAELARKNPDVRVDIVEFPIFGRTAISTITGNRTLQGSHVALAILEQSTSAYLAYHDALMSTSGGVSQKKIEYAAKLAGADLDAAAARSDADAVKAMAEKNLAYAKRLGVRGTPAVVVDGVVLPPGGWNQMQVSCLIKAARTDWRG
ncbi:thioredoxin domain-containing protein [bacterium]|nr:thioredoxin domain-containing protein [bacterium]